ncbi:UPF0746 protein DDB_G0281095-like isoform X1 [Artemia franciscana]|uniref:UPF0746 protein DDB_G0281095-like isoform X1 n=1 Tax=Artemia franciscana TaxID=6661 RepID=UPI0032D9E8EF
MDNLAMSNATRPKIVPIQPMEPKPMERNPTDEAMEEVQKEQQSQQEKERDSQQRQQQGQQGQQRESQQGQQRPSKQGQKQRAAQEGQRQRGSQQGQEGERSRSPYLEEDQNIDTPQNIPEPADLKSGARTNKAKEAVADYLQSQEAKQLRSGEELPGNLDLPSKTPEEIRQEMDQFKQRQQ